MASKKRPTRGEARDDPQRACEERLQSLIDLSSDWYWEQDEGYRFTLIKSSALVTPAFDAGELLGRTRWELGAVPVRNGGSWDEHKALLDARKPFNEFIVRHVNPKGELRYTSTNGQPIFDADNAFRGYRGIAKDITLCFQMELRLAIEHAVTRILEQSSSIAEASPHIIRVICETLDWACGARWELDEQIGAIRCGETWGVASPEIDAFRDATKRLPPSIKPGGLNRRAWSEAKPTWISDVTKDPTFRRAADATKAGLRSAFAFPIKSGAQVVGVMEFFSRETHQPDAELLNCTNYIGSQIGQFVQRAHAQERLRASEDRFRRLTELSSDWYWEQDEHLRFTKFSGRTLGKSGIEAQSLIGKQRWELPGFTVDAAQRAALQAKLNARQPFFDFEYKFADRDGSAHYLSASGMPVFDAAGGFAGYCGVAKDISERRRREEDLRRFRAAVDSSADMILLVDRATMRYVDVNDAVCRLIGYSRDELLNMGPTDVLVRPHDLLPVTREDLERAHDQLIANPGAHTGMRVLYRCKDGALVPTELTRTAVLTGDSFITVVIARDIREQLAAEEALRKSNERFNVAVRATNDVIWDWDLITNDLWWNENLTNVLGHRREDIDSTIAFLSETIHPEDRDRVASSVQQLFDSGGDSWSAEYRFRRKDGTYAHVLDRGHVIYGEGGKAVRMIGAMADVTARKEAEARIHYLATHDGLTALPNRSMFSEMLNLAIQSARRYNRHFAVLFIDLDRFKVINDTFGHEAGDKLLQEMGSRFRECLRESDIVARLGGDEFVVLLQEVNEAKQVSVAARKILSAAIRPMVISGHECRVTASIGICMYPDDAVDEQSLMKNADIAMYRAKEEGKNNYQFYSEQINVHSFERLALETSLRRALERSEFTLHYQAKLELGTGAITGVEALLRWQHPDLGMVAPSQFIPIAEDTGLIVPIGRWVFKTACQQNAAWQRAGLPPLRMAVNLSARQFADEYLLDDIAAALQESGMDPGLLELELTESMVMQNHERAIKLLAAIKAMGVRLAIDDFGVGYSSLAQIKRFPIDTLKVDRSFIRELPMDAEDQAITQAIIAMGKTLSLTVVAEGVETQEQQAFLREHACDEMQGFYFSKPIAPEQFAELIRHHLDATHAPR